MDGLSSSSLWDDYGIIDNIMVSRLPFKLEFEVDQSSLLPMTSLEPIFMS